MKSEIDLLSWRTISRVVVTVLGILFIWKTFNVLVLILVAIILATALFPVVKLLDRKLPFLIACLLVVMLLLVPFLLLAATIIPLFISEVPGVLNTIDIVITKSTFLPASIKNFDLSQPTQNLGTYLLQSTGFVTSIASTVAALLLLTFYLMFDSKRLINLLLSLFSEPYQKKINNLFSELSRLVGMYIRGNLLVALICGTLIFTGLSIMGVPFALPLAILTALLNLLPLIGLLIAMLTTAIIGLTLSPLTALLVIILYLIYQQLEAAVLAPAIYTKALNLSPALGFIALIIGSSLFGVVGAFLALPIAASLPAIIKFIREDMADKADLS